MVDVFSRYNPLKYTVFQLGTFQKVRSQVDDFKTRRSWWKFITVFVVDQDLYKQLVSYKPRSYKPVSLDVSHLAVHTEGDHMLCMFACACFNTSYNIYIYIVYIYIHTCEKQFYFYIYAYVI